MEYGVPRQTKNCKSNLRFLPIYATITDMLTQGIYHCLLLLINLLLLRSIWRSSYTSFAQVRILAYLGIFAAVVLAIILTGALEGRISAHFVLHGLAWHGSFFLFASAALIYRQKMNNAQPRRSLPLFLVLFGCFYCGVAVDALLIEPMALVARETTITTPKITKPITIVFCSDLHIARVGDYERRTLQKIKEQNADLIFFGGDYVAGQTEEENQRLMKEWNQLFREMDLHAPLGIYAVEGTRVHDWTSWQKMFTDTEVIPYDDTLTKQIGEIRITFLSEVDSENKDFILDEYPADKFRMIVGHSPRYAMAEQKADLLLAGHTHGGQVQIPFWGPLITMSGDFPKKWASGMTTMPNGAKLIVSNGVGVSQGRGPRVRFWCRSDFWVIRLVPSDAFLRNVAYCIP